MFGERGLGKRVGRGVWGIGMSLLLSGALLVSGCVIEIPRNGATEGAVGGALVGAATGAAVSRHHGRGALIGAGVGAVAGAVAGAAVESERQDRQQVREQPPQPAQPAPPAEEPAPAESVAVRLPGLALDPQRIPAGAQTTLHGICQTYGEAPNPPTGTVHLLKDGNVLVESSLALSHTGRVDFSKPIALPKNAEPGDYEVNVQVQYGPAQIDKTVKFSVY